MKPRMDPRVAERVMCQMHGRMCWDIGAHIGQAADRLAQNFGIVHAFEPCLESYQQLHDDHPANVVAHRLAVTERSLIDDGYTSLTVAEGHAQIGMLVTAEHEAETLGWGEPTGTIEVPATTMDDLANRYGPPDAVKIDTEGHEEHVVRGGIQMLATRRPTLFIEIHHRNYADEIRKMLLPHYTSFDEIRCPRYDFGTWGYDNHFYLSVT